MAGRDDAAARAGLSRSRYLQARDRLVAAAWSSSRRGVWAWAVEHAGAGVRGGGAVVGGEINAELVEAVLGYSATGPLG